MGRIEEIVLRMSGASQGDSMVRKVLRKGFRGPEPPTTKVYVDFYDRKEVTLTVRLIWAVVLTFKIVGLCGPNRKDHKDHGSYHGLCVVRECLYITYLCKYTLRMSDVIINNRVIKKSKPYHQKTFLSQRILLTIVLTRNKNNKFGERSTELNCGNVKVST